MVKPALLYLVHRIPYPPNKGDKIRSFNLLRHLARRYRVFLATFIDDPDDETGIAELEPWCEQVFVRRLSPRLARLRSLVGLLTGEPLTLPYYRDHSMRHWVERVLREQGIERAVVFSGAMAQYLPDRPPGPLARVVDFVDVDSEKWRAYAGQHRWPMNWIYRREGTRLLCFERKVAAAANASVFVSPAEAELFRRLAPRQAERVVHAANGVDLAFYDPAQSWESPFQADDIPLVFTGAMDYWPNIDAVTWFAREVLPMVREGEPRASFHIVGGGAGADVLALGRLPGVHVAGRVPDVRPWLRHAAIVVAPLRVARGIQNKVLEGLAMARPTVVTPAALEGIAAEPDREVLCGEDARALSGQVLRALHEPALAAELGMHGRALMERDYRWETNLAVFDELLEAAEETGP